MISSRNENFDNFLGNGFEENIYLVFGPSGSGKTTLCLQTTLGLVEKGRRVLFVDCEGGFSVERLKQMNDGLDSKILSNIIVIRLNDFKEQYKFFQKIENIAEEGKFDFLIIDTIGKHYRKGIRDYDPVETNNKMVEMLRKLKHIKSQERIPILLTNQVYTDLDGNIRNVGGKMVENFGEVVIKLEKNPRKAIMIKPEKKEVNFSITDLGIVV